MTCGNSKHSNSESSRLLTVNKQTSPGGWHLGIIIITVMLFSSLITVVNGDTSCPQLVYKSWVCLYTYAYKLNSDFLSPSHVPRTILSPGLVTGEIVGILMGWSWRSHRWREGPSLEFRVRSSVGSSEWDSDPQ